MADQDDAPAGAEGGPRPGAERGDDDAEVVEDAREGPAGRRGVAPGEAGAIVGADAGGRRQGGLDARPAQRGGGDAGLEHDGRGFFAAAPDVEPVSAGVDQPARRRRHRSTHGRECVDEPVIGSR